MSPNISILIVDDDLNKIYTIIATIKEVVSIPLTIDQAECISEAQLYLKEKKYHLMISDLLMPMHKGDKLLENGGEILVKEIYKERKCYNVPLYIAGLTQFKDYSGNFNKLWKVIIYSAEDEEWRMYLRDLFTHIYRVRDYLLSSTQETIFVEGVSDKTLLSKALKEYYPEYETKISIEAISYGGGAQWVARKIFIWAKSLNQNTDGTYIKAVGVLDNDLEGIKSYQKILESISDRSAERKTFSLIKSEHKFSPNLKNIKNKGIEFHTQIEDLIHVSVWQQAYKNGWLEKRPDSAFINISPSNINEAHLRSLGLTEDESFLLLNSVKNEYKLAFANLAGEQRENLLCISYLLKGCLEKCKLY